MFLTGGLTGAAAGLTGAAYTGVLRGHGARSTTASSSGSSSRPAVEWRLASSFPAKLDTIYGAAEVLSERVAAMTAAVRTETPQEAVICGTRGTVRIPSFWCPDRLIHDGREIRFDIAGNGYHYQAIEVARCLAEGQTESPTLSLDETVEIMETLDRVRAPWGLRYPGE